MDLERDDLQGADDLVVKADERRMEMRRGKIIAVRERRIIDMRFFEGKTQTEVAGEVGISQAQVSRLEKNALKAMKSYLD